MKEIEYSNRVSESIGDWPRTFTIHVESESEAIQLGCLLEALKIYAERNVKYKDNFQRMGWRGMLIRIRERAERLWDSAWSAEPGYPARDVPPVDVDDAIDLINFACFFIRAVRYGNRDGVDDGGWFKGL